jgi:hypothetical protein
MLQEEHPAAFLKKTTQHSGEYRKTHPSTEEVSKKHTPALRLVSKYPSYVVRRVPENTLELRRIPEKYIITSAESRKKYTSTTADSRKIRRHCGEFLEHISASCLSMYPNLFKFVTPFS